MGGKGGGGKAKPKFKSYAEARKDREKFRKKLVRKCDAEWIKLVKEELIMLRDVFRKKKRLFFYKSYKKGGGVISVYKNLCCRFCIVQEAFLQQKWA